MQATTTFNNTNNTNIVIENILNDIMDGVRRSNHSSGYYLRKISRVNYDNEDENCDDIKDLDYEEYKFEGQISSRPQRSQRVDYSDMMLNDEDDYDVSIRQRRFENGKVVYNCEKIRASQLDAKFDADYDYESDNDEENYVENDEDQPVNICQRRFVDGKVVYNWVKMSHAEVEQKFDEDYAYESDEDDENDDVEENVVANDAVIDDPNDEDYVYESDEDDEFDDQEESDNENDDDVDDVDDNDNDEDYVYESDQDDDVIVNTLDADQMDDPNDEDYVYESDEDDEFDDDFDEDEDSDDDASEEDEEEDREDYDDDEDYVYESDEDDELEYNYDFLDKPISHAIRAN